MAKLHFSKCDGITGQLGNNFRGVVECGMSCSLADSLPSI